jgi:phospholipase C
MLRRLAAVLALVALAHPAAAAPRVPRGIERMAHVVVIDLENHSFDNLYGEFPGADGFAFATLFPPQVDAHGVPYVTLPVANGTRLPEGLPNRPFCLSDYVPIGEKPLDLSHALDDEAKQIHGGRMDQFVLYNSTKATALGYYHTADLPLAKYAHAYVLCDRFFHSAIGGSLLSHMWLIAARTPVWRGAPDSVTLRHDADGRLVHGGYVTEDGYVVGTSQSRLGPHAATIPDSLLVPGQDFDTIGDRLSAAGVTWSWYAGGWDSVMAGHPPRSFQYHHQAFVFFNRYAPGTPGRAHLHDEAEFLAAARAGTLPAVSFVKPIGRLNQHPGYTDVLSGEDHAVELVEAVLNGPQRDSTAIVITYDEHGGFWDHVPPPRLDRWGCGTRVPTLVIAPFARRGVVDHTVYDTTSILALIERRWHLKPLASRDRRANPMFAAFDFAAPAGR